MEKIQATFYPDVDKKDLESGLTAYVSFQRLAQYLEQAIGIKEGERLLGITIDELGIKCRVEQKDNPRYPVTKS